jgi:opacity protein-like surface antigen
MLEALLSAHWYLAAQAGYGTLGGPGTETRIEQDANPKNLPWRMLNEGSAYRFALGYRYEKWGLELGYGRLGHYTRRIDTDYQVDDTAFEKVAVKAIDLRGLYYFNAKGRLTPYVFAAIAAIPYERITWEGNRTPDGGQTEELRNCIKSARNTLPGSLCAYDQWLYTDGIAWGYGGGIGAEYKLTKHWAVRGEASFMLGEFQSVAARAGVQFNF